MPACLAQSRTGHCNVPHVLCRWLQLNLLQPPLSCLLPTGWCLLSQAKSPFHAHRITWLLALAANAPETWNARRLVSFAILWRLEATYNEKARPTVSVQ